MSHQINLFNPIFLKKKKVFAATTLLQASALVFIGALLVASYAFFQSADVKKNADAVTQQLRSAEAQVATLRAEAGTPVQNKLLEDKLARTEADIQSRKRISDVLQSNDFGNTKGFSTYLSAFARQIPSGLWLTGFTISNGGNEIGLAGRSLKPELLPVYVTQLKREAIMQGKSFADLQMQLPLADITPGMASALPPGAVKPFAKAANAPYVEFTLRSSAAVELANTSGVKTK